MIAWKLLSRRSDPQWQWTLLIWGAKRRRMTVTSLYLFPKREVRRHPWERGEQGFILALHVLCHWCSAELINKLTIKSLPICIFCLFFSELQSISGWPQGINFNEISEALPVCINKRYWAVFLEEQKQRLLLLGIFHKSRLRNWFPTLWSSHCSHHLLYMGEK